MPWQGVSRSSALWAAADHDRDRFWRIVQSEWLILWIALFAVLIAVVCYVLTKIRTKPAQKEHLASEWLSKYSEMHSKGGLSDEEFRTIKTKLAEQLQDELKDNGETG
jgi:5-bromo-4-chloroindolyl phosphate hydrolysis protein